MSHLGGALMSLIGSAILAAAMKIADAPRNPAWIWILAGTTGLIGSAFIFQGIGLLLTDQWLL